MTPDEYRTKLASAGFEQIDLEPTRVYRVEDAREFLSGQNLDVDERAPLHLEIQQEEVARRVLERRKELVSPLQLGHDRDLGLQSEHRLQPLAEQRVIVRDGDS